MFEGKGVELENARWPKRYVLLLKWEIEECSNRSKQPEGGGRGGGVTFS